jgi:hypothetical protein
MGIFFVTIFLSETLHNINDVPDAANVMYARSHQGRGEMQAADAQLQTNERSMSRR